MRWRRDRSDDDLGGLPMDDLLRRYRAVDLEHGEDDDAASAAARATLADRIAAEVLRRDPRDGTMEFDRGLLAKWRRDWPAAAAHNARALELLVDVDGGGGGEHGGEDGGAPAAWNLGIAATALRDWATARRAWRAFGLPVSGAGAEPVSEDYGMTPVRLNPRPRFVGQSALLVDGRSWDTEVVWGTRIDASRVQIESIPLPGSGHRHGDVVLHDGDPNGTRQVGDREYPVFDELELWQRSPRPTLSVQVQAAADEDVRRLVDQLEEAGMGAEDWTTHVRMLCRACSEGSAGEHDHQPEAADVRTVGLSGDLDDVRAVLAGWQRGGPGRSAAEPVVELP